MTGLYWNCCVWYVVLWFAKTDINQHKSGASIDWLIDWFKSETKFQLLVALNFSVSHYGRSFIRFTVSGLATCLESFLTLRVASLKSGESRWWDFEQPSSGFKFSLVFFCVKEVRMSVSASYHRIDDSFLKIDWDIFAVYSSEFSGEVFVFILSPFHRDWGKTAKPHREVSSAAMTLLLCSRGPARTTVTAWLSGETLIWMASREKSFKPAKSCDEILMGILAVDWLIRVIADCLVFVRLIDRLILTILGSASSGGRYRSRYGMKRESTTTIREYSMGMREGQARSSLDQNVFPGCRAPFMPKFSPTPTYHHSLNASGQLNATPAEKSDAGAGSPLNIDRTTPTTPTPTPKSKEERLSVVAQVLALSLPRLFVEIHDYRIYTADVVFENRIRGITTTGVNAYAMQISKYKAAAHLMYSFVKMNVLKITEHPDDCTVRVRWQIVTVPGMLPYLMFWRLFSEWVLVWRIGARFIDWFIVSIDWLIDWLVDGLIGWLIGCLVLWEISHYFRAGRASLRDTIDGFSIFYVNEDGKVYKHVADKMIPDDSKQALLDKNANLKLAKLAGVMGMIPGGALAAGGLPQL